MGSMSKALMNELSREILDHAHYDRVKLEVCNLRV